MMFQIEKVAFRENLLSRLADDLLQVLPTADQGDLSEGLVILPSARACRTLGHVLLEKSGRDTLLLPQAVTPRQLLEEEAVAQGLAVSGLPDDSIRALVLAHHLENLAWLQDRRENAPGLAREFVAFFDEARLHGRPDLLMGTASLQEVLVLGNPAAAEVLAGDMARIGEVWELYRRVLPRDGIDLLVEAASGAAGRPRSRCAFLAVAGFARLDPTGAALITARALGAGEARLYLPTIESTLSRFFAATWGAESQGLDPLASSQQVQGVLTGEIPVDPGSDRQGSLRDRLDSLGDLSGLWATGGGTLDLAACSDQEQESQLIADRVVGILSLPGGGRQRIAVVTNDPVLATRVVAQLRDAGIDVDDTLGRPLASLPAGLLLRFLLRSALTGLRPEALLEVLTHPYTRIRGQENRLQISTLNLERMLRAQESLPTGPEDLLRQARERDEAASSVKGHHTNELSSFVETLLAAFQPLLDLTRSAAGAGEFLQALRLVWSRLAIENPLIENRSQPDITAAHRLLTRLEKDQAWLPVTSLASFSADLNRLLSEENVPPHRSQGLPVMVAGLVEARLENFDHVIIAGLNEGKFPSRSRRPLFLDSKVRAGLHLPSWRDSLARDAELFLRLLHSSPRVLLTWSVESGGQPLLRSPFLERLLLGHPGGEKVALAPPAGVWRREPKSSAAVAKDQNVFLAEPLEVPVMVQTRQLDRLSWSGLRTWRDCPYRFLLERGFALRKEDEVQEEFRRRDSGNIIHEILRQFLTPGGTGCNALASGSADLALADLDYLARAAFTPNGQVLPGRVLWLNSFLDWAPALVKYELERFEDWRPALLEARFQLPLPMIIQWMQSEINEGGAFGDVPVLNPQQAAIVLEGSIDRVDVSAAGTAECAVIDYKTGKVPPPKQVTKLRDLQVLLYSLAVETGAAPLPASAPRLASTPRVTQAFYYAVNNDRIGPPAKLPFAGDRQLLLDAAAALVDLACLASAEGPFPLISEQRAGQGPSQLPCRYCDFQGVCRLEERQGLPSPVQLKVDKLPASRKGGRF